MSKSVFLRKLLMATPFYGEYIKDDISWKKSILCNNVICIIKKLETNFIHDIIMNRHDNVIQQQNNWITVINIIYKKMNETFIFNTFKTI